MRWLNFLIRFLIVLFLPYYAAMLFLPLFQGASKEMSTPLFLYGRYDGVFHPILFFTYFLPLLAVLLFLFRKKVVFIELLSAILFVLAGVLIFLSPGLESSLADQGLHLSPWAISAAVFSFASALLLFLDLNFRNAYSVLEIVEAAMLIALAIGLDLPGLKIPLGAAGGSLSLTTVPLLILALRQGPLKGFLGAGVVYGLITCLLDGYGLMTYPFDYLLGYGSLGLLGLFRPLIMSERQTRFNFKGVFFLIFGTSLAVLFRFLAATISGIIIYEYELIPSLVYNVAYVLPSGAIAIIVLLLLYRPLLAIDHYLRKRMVS